MLMKKLALPTLFIGLISVCASAQVSDPPTLVSGQQVERYIAGGELHTYRINLEPGQLMRLVVQQKGADVALAQVDLDGKQVFESDLSSSLFGLEPLTYEAAARGECRIAIRTILANAPSGPYQLTLEVKTATAQDKRRMESERLLADCARLGQQGVTFEQAVQKGELALRNWRELTDRYWEGITLNLIGRAFLSGGKFDRAIEYFELALPVHQEVKNRTDEGNAINGLGVAVYRLGRYEQAIQHLEQALTIFRETRDQRGEEAALNSLGIQYYFLARYPKAIENFEQSIAITLATKNRRVEAMARNGLGNTYNVLGRFEEAARSFEESLTTQREVKNRNGEGTALNNLGINYWLLGQFERSIDRFQQALVIFRETKNRRAEGGVLNGIGVSYSDMGHYEKAIEHSELALAIQREEKDRNSQAIALHNLGVLHQKIDRHDKAVSYHEEALAVQRELKERANQAGSLHNLGEAESVLGRHEQALQHLELALEIYREVKDRNAEGIVLLSIGNEHSKRRDFEKAAEYYKRALAIHRDTKNRFQEAISHSFLAEVERRRGHYDKAAQYYDLSLATYRETRARTKEAMDLLGLALVERARGNPVKAHNYVEESLKLAESIRSDLRSHDARASFLGAGWVQDSYQLQIDLLMAQHHSEPTKGFDALAVEASERARARGLVEMLAEARIDLKQDVDAALLERELVLGRQLNRKAQRLSEPNSQAQAETLRKEISQLETDYERAQAAIRKASPRYASLVQPQPLKLKEIQAQLDADVLLLEYALGSDRSYLWAITRDSLMSYELPKEEFVGKRAREVYLLLTARSSSKRGESARQRSERIRLAESQLKESAQQLSQTLLAPVAHLLGNKRLVIVADGPLQYIPFAMLPAPQTPRRGSTSTQGRQARSGMVPLVVNHEVVSLPSASALAIQRSELAGRQPAPKTLAVIADPVFDRSDERLKTASKAAPDDIQTSALAINDARSIEHLAKESEDKTTLTRRSIIPRLPFTRQEAAQLLALAPRSSSSGSIDFQASRETVLNGELNQYRYVHFATHGLLDSERPGLSSLVLSMVDEHGNPQNGFLRANDIYNLKLPADLVVLSACQTGLGKEIKGEGLVGLTRGFMYAGAARVVVSLWNVNDKATSELMTKFYEKMLKRGERPAAALRAAQVEMWRQKQWQSPYYWAAFTLQGEWR